MSTKRLVLAGIAGLVLLGALLAPGVLTGSTPPPVAPVELRTEQDDQGSPA